MRLPMTTLRYINLKYLISEALWYLRGESHIKFLKRHRNPFWDKTVEDAISKNGRAAHEQWVGLNYGLLVNWPRGEGKPPMNQLKEKVINKLCKGECSRNMSISLSNPSEETAQQACTSGVQFVCRPDNPEILDLIVAQRSSDVAIGLVSDPAVWAIILHLVCREVCRTSERRMRAGTLRFDIGSAHVYEINREQMIMIICREPMTHVSSRLEITDDRGLFEIAADFEHGPDHLAIVGHDSHEYVKMKLAS